MFALILLLAQVSAPPSTGFGSCDNHSHQHELQLDDNGKPVVYFFEPSDLAPGQPPQPDIVMDGLCHDNDTEKVVDDPDRKVLPKSNKKDPA